MIVKKGLFVVCEGLDCSGKTTNIKAATEKLRRLGYSVGYSRGIGDDKEIETTLYLHPKIESFLLGTLYETIFNLRPKLEKYDVVLQDRYIISVLAHVGVIQDEANEKLVEYVKAHVEKPDLIAYFNAAKEERMKRLRKNGLKSSHDVLISDKPELDEKLEHNFSELIKDADCELFMIDTTDKTIDETSDLLVEEIRKLKSNI